MFKYIKVWSKRGVSKRVTKDFKLENAIPSSSRDIQEPFVPDWTKGSR